MRDRDIWRKISDILLVEEQIEELNSSAIYKIQGIWHLMDIGNLLEVQENRA